MNLINSTFPEKIFLPPVVAIACIKLEPLSTSIPPVVSMLPVKKIFIDLGLILLLFIANNWSLMISLLLGIVIISSS